MSTPVQRLVFVWNADFSVAGGVRALREVAAGQHSCALCEIAYQRIRQTREWKDYKHELAARLGAEIREPCRNQLSGLEAQAALDDYPSVLAHTRRGILKLLGSAQIEPCSGALQPFREQLDAELERLLDAENPP